MPQLGHFQTIVQDTSGNALSGVNVTLYREGATVNGNQSGVSPLTVTVRDDGKIVAADSVFINTATGTTYAVDSVTDTTVVLSGFAGTLTLTNGDRLVPANNTATLYGDDQGGATKTNPISSSSTGYADAYMEGGAYEVLISGGSAATTLFQSQVTPTEALGYIRYANQFATIDLAIADLPSTGGTVFVPPGTYSAAATLTPPAGSIIRGCGSLSIIQKNFNGALFTLNGNDTKLVDLTLDGNQAVGKTGTCVTVTSANRCEIRNCTVKNASTYGIYMTGSNDTMVEGNRVIANLDIGIFGEKNSHRTIVRGNNVDTTSASVAGAHCVAFHGTTAAQSTNNSVVIGNYLTPGGSAAFGVEIGSFGGTSPKDCVISGNTCIAAAASAGGYSISGCTSTSISGNIYDNNGFTVSIGVEVTTGSNNTVSGNVIQGGTGMLIGISINNSSGNAVIGNSINGFRTASTSYAIQLIATGTSNCDGCTIVGNSITFPAAGAGRGIFIQPNAAGASISYCTVVGNTVIGAATASSHGFSITVTGTGTRNIVTGNVFRNLDQGIALGTAGIKLYTSGNVLDTLITVNSGGSAVQNIAAAGDTINQTTDTARLTATGGSITLTSAPTIADGHDLQIIKIIGTDAANSVTIQDQGTLAGSNLRLGAATRILAPRDNIVLQYFDTIGDWVEISFNNVT